MHHIILMYYLLGVGVLAMRLIQSLIITDYYVTSNLLKSNMRGNEKTYNDIHRSGYFQKKLPVTISKKQMLQDEFQAVKKQSRVKGTRV